MDEEITIVECPKCNSEFAVPIQKTVRTECPTCTAYLEITIDTVTGDVTEYQFLFFLPDDSPDNTGETP